MLVGARRWGNGLAQQTVLHHFRGRAKPGPDGKTWPDRRIRVQKVVEIRHALQARGAESDAIVRQLGEQRCAGPCTT